MMLMVLLFEALFMISILISNNVLLKNCSVNKKSKKTLIYVNFVSSILIFGLIVFVLGKILSSGSSTFYKNFNIQGFSQNNPKNNLGVSATPFAVFTFTRVTAIFATILLILNGFDALLCEEKGWEWLETINWIFVSVYTIFFIYSFFMLIQKIFKKKLFYKK